MRNGEKKNRTDTCRQNSQAGLDLLENQQQQQQQQQKHQQKRLGMLLGMEVSREFHTWPVPALETDKITVSIHLPGRTPIAEDAPIY